MSEASIAMRRQATLTGLSAVLMWSLLALFTAGSGKVPPFQLSAMSFFLATLIGLVLMAVRPSDLSGLRQPFSFWLIGIGGLFGYHFLYFTALRNAPAVEAGLIAYLWPLFIVVGSALLPGERLRWYHVAGALFGLGGTALIVIDPEAESLFDRSYLLGYGAAFACAFTWSAYSLMSRRSASAPTLTVTGFCLAAMVLSLLSHWAFETTIWPAGPWQWLAVAGLGLMPVGAAFYAWDHGVKHGNIQALGASSYAAPLLSTLWLIAAGYGIMDWRIAVAAFLITGGAVLASKRPRPGSNRQGPSGTD